MGGFLVGFNRQQGAQTELESPPADAVSTLLQQDDPEVLNSSQIVSICPPQRVAAAEVQPPRGTFSLLRCNGL